MSQTLQTLALEYAAALLDWHELSLHCNRSEKIHGTVLREDENAARKARDAMYDAQQALDNAALAEAARKNAVSEPDLLKCDIQPRPLSYPLSDYHRAISEGPLHYTWTDKPHRLVYDLIAAVRYYATPPGAAVNKPTNIKS